MENTLIQSNVNNLRWKKEPPMLLVPEGTNVSRNRRLIFHRQEANLWTATQQPRVHKSRRRKIMWTCLCTQPGVLTPAWWVQGWSSLLRTSPEANWAVPQASELRKTLVRGFNLQSAAVLIESSQSSNHLKTLPFLTGITGNLMTSSPSSSPHPGGVYQGHYHNCYLFPAWRKTNTQNSHHVCRSYWLLEWNVLRANTHKRRHKNTQRHNSCASSPVNNANKNTASTQKWILSLVLQNGNHFSVTQSSIIRDNREN